MAIERERRGDPCLHDDRTMRDVTRQQIEQRLRVFEDRHLALSPDSCREFQAAQREGDYAQKEDLKRQLRQSTYDENLLLYPSQPWTCVEAEYDLGHSKVLGSQQISSISDRNHLSGINAGLERAVRLDDDASKGAKSKVGTRALRTSSLKGKAVDTSRWLEEVRKGLQGADLSAQAPSLRQSIWCNGEAQTTTDLDLEAESETARERARENLRWRLR